MEEKIKDKIINYFFIDIIYKITSKNNDIKYKLMTITGKDNEYNISYIYICSLILFVHEDNISFEKIIEYLHPMYGFNPSITHIDYSKSLTKALNKENIFNSKPFNCSLFFSLYSGFSEKIKGT